jgi:hypothetical protein
MRLVISNKRFSSQLKLQFEAIRFVLAEPETDWQIRKIYLYAPCSNCEITERTLLPRFLLTLFIRLLDQRYLLAYYETFPADANSWIAGNFHLSTQPWELWQVKVCYLVDGIYFLSEVASLLSVVEGTCALASIEWPFVLHFRQAERFFLDFVYLPRTALALRLAREVAKLQYWRLSNIHQTKKY